MVDLSYLPSSVDITNQLESRTQIEQESLLKRPESRKILSSLRDDSSSLLWLRDDDSSGTRRSIYTETSEFLDSSFTFDAEVLRSKVYLTAMRSNLKQAVRVSAQRIRHGTMSGNAANGRIDEGGKSVIGGEGRRPTKSSGIFHKPQNSISTPSVTEIQESTTDTQSTVSYESVTRPSADWSNGITETPSVAEPDMCTRRAEDEARHGSLQMPSLFKSGKPNLSSSPGSTSVASLHEVKDASAETAILLTGNAKRSALFLQRSMKLAYGRNYTKAIREAFRTSIMRRMIQNMRILLSLIKDLGFSLDPGSEFHAHIIQTVSVADVSESLPTDVCTALAVLWRDPGVLDAYHRGGIQWHWDDPE